ncbi:hypothetical protein [Rhodopila sp.]|uniref:hypothetical protein n=1 Tax=Rhodopila sp. TaxID=2480087 RepID=UPI003D14F8FD
MSQLVPQVCQLSHAGFRMLGDPVFRLSEGARVPSMVMRLEKQEAVLPLRSVAREFGVDPDSPDGQMLNLIEQALDFVVALRLGDTLPSELNGGKASWKPTEQDRMLATSRVRHNLVRCVFARMGQSVTLSGTMTPGWEDTAGNRDLMKKAIDGAAAQLDGAEVAEVTEGIGSLSEEMACIETMRRTLMRGIARPREKLLALQIIEVPVSRRDTVKQVQALARRGLKEITDRFDQVDARLDDILAMLRDLPAAIAGLRRQRDWLYRTGQAWEPMFADWAAAPNHYDDFLWRVVERSYSFLAPRFMSFQEWATAGSLLKQKEARVTVW